MWELHVKKTWTVKDDDGEEHEEHSSYVKEYETKEAAKKRKEFLEREYKKLRGATKLDVVLKEDGVTDDED